MPARMTLQEHILGTLGLHDATQGILGDLERFMRLITTQRSGNDSVDVTSRTANKSS
jgi:hypothetical protein